MLRAFSKPERRFLFVIVLVAICALLPLRWRRWVDELAAIANVPAMPFRELGKRLGVWLRPPPATATDLGGDVQERLVHFAEEADRFELLYLQERLKCESLTEQLQLVQQTQDATGSGGVRVLIAHMAGTSAPQPTALALNRGSRSGVREGAVAVWAGTHLVGRVTDVQPLSSLLLPITNPRNAGLRTRIRTRTPGPDGHVLEIKASLRNAGNGTFESDIDAADPVAIGDEARLDEPDWPSAAQMLIVGHVEDVRTMDDQPLRRRVIVRPKYLAHELGYVALKIDLGALP